MASSSSQEYEVVEVTVVSARDLKNVNWRNGELKPYAVVWVDSGPKVSSRVHHDGNPVWDEKLTVPLPRVHDAAVLYLDVVHANAAPDVKPLVGSASIPLRDVVDEGGRNLSLKLSSGRPHGHLHVRVTVSRRCNETSPYPPPAYGAPPPTTTESSLPCPPPPAYGAPPPPASAGGSAPPTIYITTTVIAAPPQPATTSAKKKKKKKKGMVKTLTAAAEVLGGLGGLALAGGAKLLEKIKDDDDDSEEGSEFSYDTDISYATSDDD